MAYKKTIKINLRCPKHSRFDPKKGRGAIVGGCKYCEGLMEVYRWENNLVNTIKDVADEIDDYITEHNLARSVSKRAKRVESVGGGSGDGECG